MGDKDTLFVLAASYDDVQAAEADYEAVKDLYKVAGLGHDFDASVITRGEDGKSRVISKHEESTRHGLKWGLAIGAATAIFPAIGLVGGMAAGAGIGAAVGHVKGGLKDSDLKGIADTLDRGQAGLIVVYATNMQDEIDAAIHAQAQFISDQVAIDRAALDEQIRMDTGS